MESTLSQTGTKRKRGIADGYKMKISNLSPHFGNLLHTFTMQYKISVQRNVETVCLLSKLHEAKHHVKRWDMDELDIDCGREQGDI